MHADELIREVESLETSMLRRDKGMKKSEDGLPRQPNTRYAHPRLSPIQRKVVTELAHEVDFTEGIREYAKQSIGLYGKIQASLISAKMQNHKSDRIIRAISDTGSRSLNNNLLDILANNFPREDTEKLEVAVALGIANFGLTEFTAVAKSVAKLVIFCDSSNSAVGLTLATGIALLGYKSVEVYDLPPNRSYTANLRLYWKSYVEWAAKRADYSYLQLYRNMIVSNEATISMTDFPTMRLDAAKCAKSTLSSVRSAPNWVRAYEQLLNSDLAKSISLS